MASADDEGCPCRGCYARLVRLRNYRDSIGDKELRQSGRNKSRPDTDGMRAAWRRSYAGSSAIAFFSIFVNLLKLATPLCALQILDRIPESRSIRWSC